MADAAIRNTPPANADHTNTRRWGSRRWTTPTTEDPDRHPDPECGQQHAEARRPGVQHHVGKHRPQRHDRPAAGQPAGQADQHRLARPAWVRMKWKPSLRSRNARPRSMPSVAPGAVDPVGQGQGGDDAGRHEERQHVEPQGQASRGPASG